MAGLQHLLGQFSLLQACSVFAVLRHEVPLKASSPKRRCTRAASFNMRMKLSSSKSSFVQDYIEHWLVRIAVNVINKTVKFKF